MGAGVTNEYCRGCSTCYRADVKEFPNPQLQSVQFDRFKRPALAPVRLPHPPEFAPSFPPLEKGKPADAIELHSVRLLAVEAINSQKQRRSMMVDGEAEPVPIQFVEDDSKNHKAAENPAITALGPRDETKPGDNVTNVDLESRSSPAATARAGSDQKNTVEDSASSQSPKVQPQKIVAPEIEAFRVHRMAAVTFAKPSEPGNGWSACGDEVTECWVKVDFKSKPWSTSVFVSSTSSTAMVSCGTEGLSGGLPVFCEVSRWPDWFPFVRESKFLHNWEDGTELWYIKLRVAAFSVDMCPLTKIHDYLLEKGYVEIITTTPAADAKDVCGVTLPKKAWGCIRGECNKQILRFTPTSLSECTVTLEYAGKEELPVEWVVKYIWSTLSKKVEPLITSQQDPWRKRGFFKEVLAGPHGAMYQSMYSNLVQRLKA